MDQSDIGRPGPAANASDEVRCDLQELRHLSGEDEQAGPFALLADRHHPLVAAELRRARRANRCALAICLIVPLAVLAAVWVPPWLEPMLPWGNAIESRPDILAAFVYLWPAALLMATVWRSASAVLAEQSGETALQLVLTPMRKRTIAAAKVLPHVEPFLWGVLAALPLYLFAGSTEFFLFERELPSPLAVWPLRIVAGLQDVWIHDSSMHLSMPGVASGLVMAVTDLGLVWAAAHWGAALAVRTTRLRAVAIRLVLRLVLVSVLLLVYLVPALFAAFLVSLLSLWIWSGGELALTVTAAAIYLGLWWRHPLRNAVRGCLSDFAGFDRLAMEAEDPSRRDLLRPSAWWWYDGRRA